MSFFIGNQKKFQINSSVHNINTRNKHHPHRPVANLSCFQKGASYSGIRIVNSLPQSITNLKNEKTQFKVALKKFLNAHSFYSVNEFFTCTDDMYCWLYDCVNVSYTVIFLLFVCLWHVPSCDSQGSMGCIYVCMCRTHTYLPMKMEQTECCKTSAYKLQTPGNYPEKNIQHSSTSSPCKISYDAIFTLSYTNTYMKNYKKEQN